MNKIPTAEDILDILIPYKDNVSNEENIDSKKQNIETLIGWVNLYREAILKEVNEKATIIIKDDYSSDFTETKSETVRYKSGGILHLYPEDCTKHTIEISYNSIFNAYPLENIK